jgi:hypothetical protein
MDASSLLNYRCNFFKLSARFVEKLRFIFQTNVIFLLVVQLPNRFNSIILLRIGAVGYIFGFLSWLCYVFQIVPLLIGYQTWFPTEYYGVIPTIVYSLLSISYFLSSFSCLGFMIKHNSRIAVLCFVSYIATGSAWSFSIFNTHTRIGYHSAWSLLGYTSMIVAQLVWGIMLLRSRKYLPRPQVYKMIGICFILSGILCVIYWPITGLFGLLAWLAGFGWLYAIGAAASAILLIKHAYTLENPRA